MKKLISLIFAGVFTATTLLAGCSDDKNAETKKDTPEADTSVTDTTDPRVDPEADAETEVEGETEVDLKTFPTDSSAAYQAHFETNLEKVIEKSDLDNETLITIEGVPVSAAFVRYAVISGNLYYEGTQEEKDAEIDRYLRVNAYLVNEAVKNGISITNDDFRTNITENIEMLKMYYGEDLASVIDMYMHQTPFAYYMTTFYNLLYSKLSETLYEIDGFEEELKDATLKALDESETPYVRAKHILISFPEEGTAEDGSVTDEQKAETLAKAEEVLALVNGGEDFDKLVQEYGKDPGMEAYPGGYYFTTGEMVAPFEETAFALEEGEVSGLVETDFGYHIIMRLPLDDAEAIKGSSVYQTVAGQLTLNKFSELSKDYEFVYSDNYEERCAEFLAEAEELATAAEETEDVTEEVAE